MNAVENYCLMLGCYKRGEEKKEYKGEGASEKVHFSKI